jgi:outer membrane protein assembly factor BamB
MSCPKRLAAFDPFTGKEFWTCSGLNELVYTSPLYADGIVVAMGGYLGSSLAAKPGGHGDVTATRRLWHIPKTQQRIGSGVISGRYLYILNDPGIAECLELQTGQAVWSERLKGPGPKSDAWSSMVLAGGKLYVVNQSGDTFVLQAIPRFEVLATNSVGETTMASLAVSNGEIYIRTHQNLWCIGGLLSAD